MHHLVPFRFVFPLCYIITTTLLRAYPRFLARGRDILAEVAQERIVPRLESLRQVWNLIPRIALLNLTTDDDDDDVGDDAALILSENTAVLHLRSLLCFTRDRELSLFFYLRARGDRLHDRGKLQCERNREANAGSRRDV